MLWVPAGSGILLFSSISRLILVPIQPDCYLGLFLQGLSTWNVMLTTRLHLVLWLRMHDVVPPLILMSSWNGVQLSTGTTFLHLYLWVINLLKYLYLQHLNLSIRKHMFLHNLCMISFVQYKDVKQWVETESLSAGASNGTII